MENISDLTKHQYFGPLIYSYVETILNSRELLDEDLEATLTIYRTDNICVTKPTYVPYSLIASTSSLVPSIVAAKKLGSFLYLVPSAVLTTGFAYYSLREKKKRKNHEMLMENLVEILKDTQELNKRIYTYLFERRTHLNKYLREFFQPFTSLVIDFVKVLSKHQFDLHHLIISNIFIFSEFCKPLKEDCKVLNNYQPSTLTDLLQGNLDNYLEYAKKVIAVQQILNSKILSYFVIICCCDESTLNKRSFNAFISHRLPFITRLMRENYQRVLAMFHALRRSVIRFSEMKLEKRTVTKERISGKLRLTLDTAVNNLCFVLEKLYNIMDVIEGADGIVDQKTIDQGLIDLRSHTAATYDALDILCRLYGILSEPQEIHAIQPASPSKEELEKPHPLHFLDEKDPRDLIEDKEKYELYLKATEKVEDFSPIYEEASDTYLRLMIKELKQNLYQHEFYVSARERWRDESDEEELLRNFNRQNSVHDLENFTDDESTADESSCDDENEVTVREPGSMASSSAVAETSITDTNATRSNSELPQDSNGSSLEKQEDTPNKRNGSAVNENDLNKIDTLTRTVQNEEKDKWNPILQDVKEFSKNMQLQVEQFGEDGDSN